ncbi:MAG: hypothetical protein LBI55_01565 [Oscillospiraceae bacterium]|nr:hypothetical protein [Oscillospiraceae bacterium]
MRNSKIFKVGGIASIIEGFIYTLFGIFILLGNFHFMNIFTDKSLFEGILFLITGIVEALAGFVNLMVVNNNDAMIFKLLCNITIIAKSFLIRNIFFYFINCVIPVFNLTIALTVGKRMTKNKKH